MDFISIADTAWSLHRKLASGNSGEDDDFAEISGGGSDSLSSASTSGQTLGLDTSSIHVAQDEISVLTGDQTRPFLSPSAEAELLLLATNFLLYVAMVIITAMIAKLYFPECLETRRGEAPAPRSYAYRMVDGQNELIEHEEDDSDGAEQDEYLDSGDEQDPINRMYPTPNFTTRPALEFDQETMSKAQVLKRLLFCSLMLNITFVTWGLLQERMLTRRYPRITGEYFTYSYALVFTNRFWTLIISSLFWIYLKPRRSRSTVIYEYSFPSISNMLSSWCQYEALRYVSFPATTLFKSFKLAPVMAMGKILGNKTYPTYDYFVALVIGVGITFFMSSSDDLKFGYDIYGEASATWTGVMLLFLYLFFDSFTSQWQSRMFQRHRDLSMVELMFATSAFSTVLAFVTLLHTKELTPALSFITNHPEIHLHFFAFSICSTIGQIFIFYTIKNFGAVVFTLIMTTRILLSIAFSCILYGHEVTGVGFMGLMMVMGAVLYRIKRKAEGQKILKWQGMDDNDKEQELVQEWHEHVDM
ncbi:UAA transporter family [Fragilaria crotonensis]|nr:UAA transporter family [Fragilaria crotonensis]